MALGVFILCGYFNITRVEFTCMAISLPYKTACAPIIDVLIIDSLHYVLCNCFVCACGLCVCVCVCVCVHGCMRVYVRVCKYGIVGSVLMSIYSIM